MKEVLAYGERNPEEQRNDPIVGLGSVAGLGGVRRVGFLYGGSGERRASLRYYVDDWSGDCRFLGVRKDSVA